MHIGTINTKILSLLLLILLLTGSCNSSIPEKNILTCQNEPQVNKPSNQPNEVIVFIGNPGVGKSTLCNSIFQQAIFNSGFSFGTGLTQEAQEYIYENKLYIDTPGLDDVINYERAAKEVEKALKKNNNYKILFVTTFEEGRIRAADLATISIVCMAIRTNFEYGLIFNKVPKEVIDKINDEGQDKLYNYLSILRKKPSEIIILIRDEHIASQDNMYFNSNDNNREKLLECIDKLKACRIDDRYIQKVHVIDFQNKVEEMEHKINACKL
jgi:GTP-binding protein EngB required for normal cell division